MKKTFVIVDDHALMRQGIVIWLEKNSTWRCVGEASCLSEAHSLMDALASKDNLPAILIEDLNLGKEDGLVLVKELSKAHPEVKSVVYSMYTSSGMVHRSLSSGAKAYVSKSATETELLQAIENVADGKVYIEQQLLAPLISFKDSISSLTKREGEVLELTISGLSNQEIATKLQIEKRAVENYLSRIYNKTECKSHYELCCKFGGAV